MGPVLAGLLTYAGATGSLIDGAGLFLQVPTSLRGVINRAGGVILIVMGILLFTGSWTAPFAPVLR